MILEFVNRLASHGVTGSYMVLHDSSESDICQLHDALEPLTGSEKARLAIHDLPFVSCIEDCQLHAVSARQDSGVLFRNVPGALTLVLSAPTWNAARETLVLLAAGSVETADVHLNPTEYGPRVVCTRDPVEKYTVSPEQFVRPGEQEDTRRWWQFWRARRPPSR